MKTKITKINNPQKPFFINSKLSISQYKNKITQSFKNTKFLAFCYKEINKKFLKVNLFFHLEIFFEEHRN